MYSIGFKSIGSSGTSNEPPVGAVLLKTGQTTSYRTGDDGDLEDGREVNFLTLSGNNPFDNTDRFTDVLGGQTYTNRIMLDWSTYNNSTVLGYRMDFYDDANNWNDAVDFALLKSIGGFTSGWKLTNNSELDNLVNEGVTASGVFNYPPLNYTGTQWNLFSSNTIWNTTTNCYVLSLSTGERGAFAKANGGPRYMVCRIFTVTGTTLT